ncbi:DinB family protein [Crossiella sp. CA-258035]|uniref:DinB family protein n=1 Tax=Crossiella sp. CA-258035 TaxID=2981138 RepID=UPI0024BC9FF7|nr:DinB family protein [Crossiella sp. CA-258035]WHT22023.1 DinB family protein [Crossiella sp. CA-258035]
MALTQPAHVSPNWPDDPRAPLPLDGSEREILTAYLDWHRATFELKCRGVRPEALSHAQIPPSTLTLHGILRHLAGAERWWFQMQFARREVPHLHYSDEDPSQDFDRLDGDVDEAFAQWRAEVAVSREIVAAHALDDTGVHLATGRPLALRRVLVHMIAEYARHCGHADLLRERTDGVTGH